MQPNLDIVPRSFFSRLATRMFSKSVIPDAMQREAQPNGASQIRDLAPQPSHIKSRPPFLSYADIGQPIWAPRDYAAFAREGFMQNAVVYRCVRLIAENAAAVPLLLYSGDTEIEYHPLKTLIRAPHPTATYPDFMESIIGFLLVSGNAYIEAVSFGGEIRELHLLRPDRVKVVPGSDGWPEAYDYTVDGRTTRIEGEAAPGIRRVLHMRLFHPVNDHYGLSPIEAAACAIDLHNAAAKWNKALLDNSARPSGALVYTSRDGNLTPDQFDRLKSELETNFQGTGNAGRPLLLEGGLDWKAMSMTPKDLDFVEAKNAAAREIALALGVPPLLLGIPGDNTYSNYAEANSALWRQTIIPLVERIALQLGNWLGGAVIPDAVQCEAQRNGASQIRDLAPLRFVPDTDQLPALAAERDALWKRLEGASFLTTDEKRIAAGYGANPNRLSEKAFNPSQPRDDQVRWTDGDGSLIHDASRRRTGPSGAPAQEARFEAAAAQARDAVRRLQELDPTWRRPESVTNPSSIEGAIAHQEAIARAAGARRNEILRDAIPGTNPTWGVQRLTKELRDRAFVLDRPARGEGLMYRNPETGEQVRIMERPAKRYRTDPDVKHTFEYYYRYQRGTDQKWGSPVPVPNK